jgi:hypothetical protein
MTPPYWPASALRGRPLSAAQSSPAPAARLGVDASLFRAGALRQHGYVLARIRLTRTAAERGPVLSGERGQGNGFQPLVVRRCLPCASPRSEHGILGKRRVKLRSPAVGRASRGCQPDEQIRPRLSGTLWSAAVRVRGSRAQRRGRCKTELTSTHATARLGTGVNGAYFVLRARLSPTSLRSWHFRYQSFASARAACSCPA